MSEGLGNSEVKSEHKLRGNFKKKDVMNLESDILSGSAVKNLPAMQDT